MPASGKDIYEIRRQWTEGKLKMYKQRRNWTRHEGPDNTFYPVEHLATFSVDRKEAVLTVEDSIRKLKLMDAKGKIWSQEMTLQLTDREIILIDNETQETLENFPLNSIIMATAVINECNYNSVLVFSCKDSSQKNPDMHLFQCDHIPADVISGDLQNAVDYATGKTKKKPKKIPPQVPPHPQRHHPPSAQHHPYPEYPPYQQDMMIPPPPREMAPEPPSEGNVRNKVALYTAAAKQENGQRGVPRVPMPVRSPTGKPSGKDDDSIEMLALRTERDVEILNHCFSDVEYFVAKLQKAADAYNELARRKKNRKSKKKQAGDGVLQARSRPPSEDEYFDVFQKIKFAFNLLAKLKAHIHDPNAPELVHFLFTPLELIIQSCNGPELARTVVSPLLTPQAIELLRNCLASREGELWVSLGPAWTTPKAAWPKDQYVPPFVVPKFRDGWEPPVFNSHPDNAREEIEAAVAANAAAVMRAEEVRKAQIEGEERVFQFPPPSGTSYGDTYFAQHQGQQPPQHQPHSKKPELTPTTDPAVAAFKANVAKHVDRNYEAQALAKTRQPQPVAAAQAPPQQASYYSSHIPTPPQQQPSPSTHASRDREATTAKYDFVARNSKELTIMAGESLEVVDDSRMWWCVRNSSGQTGFVPSTILETSHTSAHASRIPSPPPQSPPPVPQQPAQDPVYHHHVQQRAVSQNTNQTQRDSVYASNIPRQTQQAAPPPPPPPPPPPGVPPPNITYAQAKKPPNRQSSFRRDSDASNDLQQQLRSRQALKKIDADVERAKRTDDLHEELKRRVNQGNKRNFVPRQRTHLSTSLQTHFQTKSPRVDVQRFSKLTVDSLGVLTGAQLFSLTKEELKQVCYEDGSRVYSQLMVQKSRLEDSLNGSAELQAIMQRRKERANSDNYEDSGAFHQPPPDFSPATPPGFNSSGDTSPSW
ncbi:LOW QUALITY PROTEIN: epidermal growth factor receptor kinase substrate 8-like [Ptychodera flava]|uniref:LOW QUALITY PROTEIN: epidermal growth factor receptor kinase substrate 8-like n=1 Tax=Ptychodera flava TaxID=63121 RepID=UPI003969E59E